MKAAWTGAGAAFWRKRRAAWLEDGEATELFAIAPGKAKIQLLPLFGTADVQIGPTFHEVGDEMRAHYLAAHAQLWDEVEVPTNPHAALQTRFEDEACARTVDKNWPPASSPNCGSIAGTSDSARINTYFSR